jgi:transcriptional regulator with XRE-family HTH domain
MARVELGERIATLREEQALTQAELANRANISPSTLSLIESGKVPHPHVGTIRKIARALGVEPQELRRTEESGSPKVSAAPLSPEWALAVPDDSFRRAAKEASTESLWNLVMELVGNQQPRLFETERGQDASPEELYQRAVAFNRALIVREELLRRGEQPPERQILALKRHIDALNLREEPTESAPAPPTPERASEAEQRAARLLGAWRRYVWDLVLRWEKESNQPTPVQVRDVLDALQRLIDSGVFERPAETITTGDIREFSDWFDMSTLFQGIDRLHAIAERTVDKGAITDEEAERVRSTFGVIDGFRSEWPESDEHEKRAGA